MTTTRSEGNFDDNREHLESIHLRHAQIEEEQIELLAFDHRERLGAIINGVNGRLARQSRENLLVDLQNVLLVVEDEDALPGSHLKTKNGAVARSDWRSNAGSQRSSRHTFSTR